MKPGLCVGPLIILFEKPLKRPSLKTGFKSPQSLILVLHPQMDSKSLAWACLVVIHDLRPILVTHKTSTEYQEVNPYSINSNTNHQPPQIVPQ